MDITNYKQWNDSEWLSFAKERLVSMRTKKWEWETRFKKYEVQNNAVSLYDNNGELQVNIPLEKALGEIYMGRTEWKVTYDIIPDGQANIEELQPSKYALSHFLDGNEKDNFWKENRLFRDYKRTYGTGIFYCGLRNQIFFSHQLKDKNKVHTAQELLDPESYNEVKNESWLFFPQAIHPMDFYIDDKAYGQPDAQSAEDCIRKEKISILEFQNRYGDNPAYKNVSSITGWYDQAEKNTESTSIDKNEVIVYHYYHRILKKYIIFANETTLILNWLYIFWDGKLPFVTAHHYFRSDRFWWEGIPERVAYLKAYKSEIFQDILSWAAMSSGLHLVVWNDEQIGRTWNAWGRTINLWRTTWGAENVKQVNTSPNLGYFTTVLDMIDRQIAVDSGINPLEQFDPWSDKVGIVEIMEANKSVRNRSVDEWYNIALDEALTMTLDIIKQFAPAVLKVEIKWEDGELLKTIWQPIRIDNYEIEKKKWQQLMKESMGKYGYFELKPWTIMWSGVKVTTPSTNSLLPILERQKVSEYLTNITSIANIAQLDSTGDSIERLKDFFDISQVIGWVSDAYGYDSNWLKAFTEKDKIRKEIVEKTNKLKEILTTQPNVQENPILPPSPQSPTEALGSGQAMWWSPQTAPWVTIWM